MSWLFSQALVEEYSAANSLDGEPFVQLNVMPTQHKFWRNDKTMEFSKLSQFGLTCQVLTESRGAELLTWFLAGFHAKTLAPPAKGPGLKAKEAAYGQSSNASFARYDHGSHGWKTAQCLLLGGWESFLETWPKWGLMQNGVCWEYPTLGLRTKEKEFGFLPTPTRREYQDRARVSVLTKLYNRPQNYDGCLARTASAIASKHGMLPDDPVVTLNPPFAEQMMGWPVGMTGLEQLATDKFQSWLQQHSESLLNKGAK